MSRFDEIINRKQTNSMKWSFLEQNGYEPNALAMWVADMDFRAPDAACAALRQAVEHGIFGYTDCSRAYLESVRQWQLRRHGCAIEEDWIVLTPGVVFAVGAAVRAFTAPGDGILLQRPVYYPFSQMIELNGREVRNSPLLLQNGRYEIDFEDFERKAAQSRMFILCNPHNPGGRVWTKEELLRIGEICNRHGVLVVSDEIHCDLVYPGHVHIPYPLLGDAYAQNCIVCTAPSKTFNIAGLQLSNILIPNAALRGQFEAEVAKAGLHMPGILGAVAAEACYCEGADWLDELTAYMMDNIAYVRTFLQDQLPEIRMMEPESTYQIWLDFRALGLTDAQLYDLLQKEAGVWLDKGTKFGEEGSGFMRLNAACPRALIEDAMARMQRVLRK